MERKLYIQLCQTHNKVRFNGSIYQASAYKLGFDENGNPIHQCEIIDIGANSNSLVICGLNQISEVI